MEQLSHNQLKETWEQANLQFVSIQDKLKQEIRHLKGERSASPRYVYAASCCVFYMFSIVTRVACEKMP